MAGFDPRDSTSVDRPVDDYPALLEQDLAGLRVGMPDEYFGGGLEPGVEQAVRDAIRVLEDAGARVQPVRLPHGHLAVPAYYVVAPAECSSNLSRYDGVRFGYRCDDPQDLEDLYKRSRSEGFGAEVKRRVMVGTYALSAGYFDAYYLKAQKVRRLIKDDYEAAFREVDVIAGPTTPAPAFRFGDKTDDPVTMYLSDIYTIAANLAGLPGISVPAGLVGGLPVGLQLVGPHFDEARLLAIAHRYQQATDWHTRSPAEHA
jgi:aspartyl-tRNA(Asn)/glutamyl-tRNA(Gln) amidotransferase subunit A